MNCYTSNDDDCISSTGELTLNDSTLIAFTDLRIINSKLIELRYEKAMNDFYKDIIKNDSIVIDTLYKANTIIINENEKLIKSNKKYKKQRNVAFGIGIIGIILTTIMSVK